MTAPAEATATATTRGKKLDLVFVCDCTGSMGSYLKAAQDNIRSIAEAIATSAEGVDVQFALVEYRDHPPQDDSFAVRVSPFTAAPDVMKTHVDKMRADGGGDGPESVVDGMAAALEMPWREDSAKVAVLIADAPPHGLGTGGDGFPNGCPCERDPIQVARACAKKGIVFYTVGAEPALSRSGPLSLDFMRAVAKLTSGLYLPLGSAGLLAKVIIGSALEQVQLRAVLEEIAGEVRALHQERGAEFTKEMAAKFMAERLRERHVEMPQLKVGDIYDGQLEELDGAWSQYNTLPKIRDALLPKIRAKAASARPSAARGGFAADDDMGFGDFSFAPSAASASASVAPVPSMKSIAAQTAELSSAVVTEEQADRLADMGMAMDLFD